MMASVYGVIPWNALLRRYFSVGGRERNFKLVDLIPLSIGSLSFRNRQKRLQALAWGNRLWFIHVLLPLFQNRLILKLVCRG